MYVYRRSYPKCCSSMDGHRRNSKNELHMKILQNSKRNGLPENSRFSRYVIGYRISSTTILARRARANQMFKNSWGLVAIV